jgi:hypothetical protein
MTMFQKRNEISLIKQGRNSKYYLKKIATKMYNTKKFNF